ncbi:YaaL family protein [Limosilactobacillus viscerum]|uniref:YaaL family protein n=1 Tax=Limosilactobacillus viscerum TaxID=2993450 RepID=UPI0024BA6445|nr:YaaL family protein [Limosilactobacillus viscerum]
MLFKRKKNYVEQERNQRLLDVIYDTKASWDHAQETQRAVYEANVSNELRDRTKIQEQKYLYLYKLARKYKVHGKLNKGVISH